MTTQEQELLNNVNEERVVALLQKAFEKKKADMAKILGNNLEKLPDILAQVRSQKRND